MDSCLKYGDLIVLHYNNKLQANDSGGANAMNNSSIVKKEGFLAAMG